MKAISKANLAQPRLMPLGAVMAGHVLLVALLAAGLHTPRQPARPREMMVQLQPEPEQKAMPPLAEPLLPLVAPHFAPPVPVPAVESTPSPTPIAVALTDVVAPPAPVAVAPTATPPAAPTPSQAVAEEADASPSVEASAAGNPKPAYPKASRALGEQGRVLLDVYVLADGSVGEVRVHQSSGFDRLDESAQHAVRQWRFKPARHAGKQVAMWYVQPIAFDLRNA